MNSHDIFLELSNIMGILETMEVVYIAWWKHNGIIPFRNFAK